MNGVETTHWWGRLDVVYNASNKVYPSKERAGGASGHVEGSFPSFTLQKWKARKGSPATEVELGKGLPDRVKTKPLESVFGD